VIVTGVIANHKGGKFLHVLYVLCNVTGVIKTIEKILSKQEPEVQWYRTHSILFCVESSLARTVSRLGHDNYSFIQHRSKYQTWFMGLSYRMEKEVTTAEKGDPPDIYWAI